MLDLFKEERDEEFKKFKKMSREMLKVNVNLLLLNTTSAKKKRMIKELQYYLNQQFFFEDKVEKICEEIKNL